MIKILTMIIGSDRYLVGVFDDERALEWAIRYQKKKHRGIDVEFETRELALNLVLEVGA